MLSNIRAFTREGRTIPLVRDPTVTSETFVGAVGPYTYLFEGEDDLLHLAIERKDGARLVLGEATAVAQFLLPGVPEAMIWLRPGEKAHHYYLGHDLLLPSE